MYKHKVEYRYKDGSGISPRKYLEFELDDRLYYDGPGKYKSICANIISTKTGINASDVLVDELKLEYLGVQKTKSVNNTERVETQTDRTSKIQAQNDKQRQDHEERKYRDAQDAKEKAERKQKADKLRSEGKKTLAFIVEYQTAVIGAVAILGFAIFFIVISVKNSNKKENAIALNTELELIEDNVKLLINESKYDEALTEVNKLTHPIHEVYPGKGTTFNEIYYDEYWNDKRTEYKELIFSKNKPTVKKVKSKPKSKKGQNEVIEDITEDNGLGLNEGLGTEYQIEQNQ